MTTYTISFTNNHDRQGKFSNYCFFNQQPVVNGNTADPNCFTNAWISKAVPAGGNIKITTSTTYYAWTGTAPQKVAKGVIIETGKGLVSTLGTQKASGSTFSVTNDSGTPDIGPAEKNTGSPSSFEIDTGTDFMDSDLFLIGLGLNDDKGKLVPSAVIPADQNMSVNIMPIVKFYVSKNDSRQGTVVDFAGESRVAGVIDFTDPANQGKQFANVSHDRNGLFTVSYSDQASFNAHLEAHSRSKQNGTLLKQDVAELQSQIVRLEQLFETFLANGIPLDHDVESRALYIATVGWLRSMTPRAINAAWGIIWNYLRSRGYNGTFTFDSNNFTTTVTITIVPKHIPGDLIPGAVPAYISNDWHDAVAADSKDKPTDMGIVAAQKAISDLKHESRQYLQKQGIATNGN